MDSIAHPGSPRPLPDTAQLGATGHPPVAPPFVWSDGMKRAIAQHNTPAAGMEVLAMDAGFRALPVDPETKAPFAWLTPHGVLDATDDPVIFQQWMAVSGDAGLGIVPGPGFAILDDDRGDLDPSTYGIAGTYSETTRRGFHHWTLVPAGRQARKRKIDGGDLLTGARCYVVSSPTTPYRPTDLEAAVLSLPHDSILLDRDGAKVSNAVPSIATPTAADRLRAQKVVAALLHAPDPKMRADVERLLNGDTTGHTSPSEADYNLALMASFHTTDPRVVLAVLQGSDLRRPKWTSNKAYLPRTIGAALARRAVLRDGSNALSVSYVATPFTGDRKGAILGCLASPDAVPDSEGFSRVPVLDIAAACGVARCTIFRDLCTLERDGVIESEIRTVHRAGRVVRTRWARLTAGEAAS